MNFSKYNNGQPIQLWFNLLQKVVREERKALVCIPDRTSAECALTEIKHRLGSNFIKARIDRNKSKTSKNVTFTLHYFYRSETLEPVPGLGHCNVTIYRNRTKTPTQPKIKEPAYKAEQFNLI